MNILYAQNLKKKYISTLSNAVSKLKKRSIYPKLAIILVGEDKPSQIYIRNKMNFAKKIGCSCLLKHFLASTKQEKIIGQIKKFNSDKTIHGILVQLPLPKTIDQSLVIQAIDPNKDVDCLTFSNYGKLWCQRNYLAKNFLAPPTSLAIMAILESYNISIASKNVTIIGRSNIVSKPLAALMLLNDATVTICHSKTKNLAKICANSEILVVAIGRERYVTKKYTNPNQIIIDVGINFDKNEQMCGDVDFEHVKKNVKAISPVPYGVGQMTVAMLFNNLINLLNS
jgi:methylenetetrahydrofolate dehydrogenase (NADP+)/methenyltetrahydrofolate cyclohydrolase